MGAPSRRFRPCPSRGNDLSHVRSRMSPCLCRRGSRQLSRGVETANDLSEKKRTLLERYLRQQLPAAAIGAVQAEPVPAEASSSAHPRVPVVTLQRGGSMRPFFYLHVHWQGGPLYCFTLARKLGADYPT